MKRDESLWREQCAKRDRWQRGSEIGSMDGPDKAGLGVGNAPADLEIAHPSRRGIRPLQPQDVADPSTYQPGKADAAEATRLRYAEAASTGPFTPAVPIDRAVASAAVVQAGTLYALVSLCRAAGLTEPIPEYRFHPIRRWRFDYAWPMHKLALEVEGGIWTQGRHSRGAGMAEDMKKYSEAAILGWRLLYVEPRTLKTDGLDYVRRALGTMPEAA